MKNKKKNSDLNASRSINKDVEMENFNYGKLNCWCEVDFNIIIPKKVEFNTRFSCDKGKVKINDDFASGDIELTKMFYLKQTVSFLLDNLESIENEDLGFENQLEDTANFLDTIALRLLEQYACKKGIRLEEKKCSHQ